MEKRIAKANPKLFSREKEILVVNLENKDTIKFIDIPTDNSSVCVAYSYLSYLPEIKTHLIEEQWYEGGQMILVNDVNGQEEKILNFPVISPDKKRCAVANKDLIAGYSRNGIQVFEVCSGNIIRQFQQETDWGPDNLRWIRNDLIVVDKYIVTRAVTEVLDGTVTLNFNNNQWIIE